MSFRAIKPVPPGGFGDSPMDRAERLNLQPVKRQMVAQACRDCRRTKIKCDGKRPKCSACALKDRPCGYAENRPKTRLELLEKLMSVLRSGTQAEAGDLLERIRAAKDLNQAADEQFDDAATGSSSKPASRHGSFQSNTGASSQESLDAPSTAYRTSSSDSQPSVLSACNPTETDSDAHSADADRSPSGGHTDPAPESFKEAPSSRSPLDAPKNPALRLPDALLTLRAIESFFNCSGKLFHVFSREQVSNMYHLVFNPNQDAGAPPKLALGAVMAVSAVGSQYTSEQFSPEVTVGFYNIARYYFEAIVENDPSNAIRVCTLLAMYNIMDKAMVSIAYVEIGLGISRMYGLSNKANRVQTLPDIDGTDLRKTWRTLIFFSSWLSSTLGYISGNDIMSERLTLADIIAQDSTDMTEVVQTEMTKICVLKSNIIRMQWTFQELTADTIHSIMRDLQIWYGELPDMMRLEAAGHEDMPVETSRSILHVHLLYLGALMLLYRQIARQFVRSYKEGGHASILPGPLQEVVLAHNSEVALAASTSARIVKLLYENNNIFKRCWLVIFQTYTTCTMLLHVAVQKQLHNFEPSTWQDEKTYAEDCLAVLSFCGSLDRVAARFHAQLIPVFQRVFQQETSVVDHSRSSISEVQSAAPQSPQGPHGSAGVASLPQPIDHGFLLGIPNNADVSLVEISIQLMTMLGEPYNSSFKSHVPEQNTTEQWGDPTHREQLRATEPWTAESRGPFQWDFNKLNPSLSDDENSVLDATIRTYDSTNHLHSFIDSAEPSGWTPALHVMKPPGDTGLR